MLTSSDDYHDVTCSPCFKEKRNVAATEYCVECENYLCQMCLIQHNRFGMMKFHRIVRATAAVVSADDVPIQRCNKHHGNLLDMYCSDHDVAICTVCAALDHSSCNGTKYLPDVVKNSNNNKEEYEDISCRITSLQTKTDEVKLARIKHSEIFECQKVEIMRQLKCIRKMADMRFDDLEHKLKISIDKETKAERDKNETDSPKLEHIELVLKDQKQTLERVSKTGNAASVFVQTRIAKTSIAEAEELEKLLESTPKKNLFFLPNQKLNKLFEDLTSLGEIVDNVPKCSAELHRIAWVRASGEKSVSTISGVCSLNNGSILIVDWQNESLKRLDENYNVAEHLDFTNQPYDICTVGTSEVAVTIPKVKRVQFLSTEKAIKMTSTFSVRDACRGIACASGLLYVACGGWKVYKEGPGHVEVYTTSGVYQQRFGEHLSQPGHISFACSRLYVADNTNGLVIMDANGCVLTNFTHKHMHNPLAVCAGPGNQLFLGGWSSHNVMLMTSDGQLLLTLLTKESGVRDLHTLFYDESRSRLIYTMRDIDEMKIFDLNFTRF